MGKINRLLDRLNQNLTDYYEHIKGFDKQQIIEMAGRIGEMTDVHMYLTDNIHDFDSEEIDFLLRFQDPLEVIADAWQQRTADLGDIAFVLEDVVDKLDALEDYPLADIAPDPRKPSAREWLAQAAKEAAARPRGIRPKKNMDKQGGREPSL